jgi:hypothetical protein
MATIISIMMLAAIALIAGAIFLRRRGAPPLQIALMLAVAFVIVANVVIWTLPIGDNAPLMKQVPR